MLGIMVVEDREPIAQLLRDMLVSNGYSNVYLASEGKDALEIFNREHPKIVLMDLLLPDMNGLEVTARLLDLDPNLKIIAMTAMSGEGLLEEVLKAGCVGLLTKPFRMKELIGALDDISVR